MKTSEKNPIIILHGWGLKGSLYSGLAQVLRKKNHKVYTPDLPGFGAQPLKSENMNLDDYVSFLGDFIKKNRAVKPILIGHSFGGRVAIKYVYNNPNSISKLILTGVPVIREITFRKKIGFLVAGFGGKVLSIFPLNLKKGVRKILYYMIGEWDYYKSGALKEVFKNIIAEDISKYLKEIKIPVLLVWGEKDVITPVSLVGKIKKISPEAGVVIVSKSGHRLPYLDYLVFVDSIKSFI